VRTGRPKNKRYQPLIGTCYLHTVIDDHSRVAYVETREDETKANATDVLKNPAAWFAERRHRRPRAERQRQLLQVPPLTQHLRRFGHHREEDPALPTADQRQD
jgi:hypothetical protein